MSTVLIVPGWRDSGPGHWQTLWAEQLPGAVRVHQDDWITPTRTASVASITRHILEIGGPVVIAAHSLGCIATSHLPPEAVERIVGALLVAPADPNGAAFLRTLPPCPTSHCPTAASWWPAPTTRFARCALQVPMHGRGRVNSCACPTPATSTWRPASAPGRWAVHCCRACFRSQASQKFVSPA